MNSLRLGLASALVLASGCYQGVDQRDGLDSADELSTSDTDDPTEGGEGVTTNGSGDGDGDGDADTGWSTGDGDDNGDGDDEDTGWTTGEEGTCSQHAQQQGWKAFYCDQGSGVCNGAGVSTGDCELCCSGPSCGDLAADNGWDWASCEQNGNRACGGAGTPTYDCDYCCGAVDRPQPMGNGFGYPVGDKSSSPAGGWVVWQVMAHYWAAYGGRHLAQDIASAQGGVASVNAPVYSVADGVVRYAGPNGSSYKNVVLIEHDDGEGGKICSFYGHVNPPIVSTGQDVTRGQQVTSVRDWALCVDGGASSNTHLHYVLVSKPLCDASAAANGSLMCGYDKGGPNNVVDLATEPYTYTAINDICGDHNYPDAFISPTKFIDDHHF
ncbi:MAG: M23 family metallopeptidase [Enhygromyxa sp.]